MAGIFYSRILWLDDAFGYMYPAGEFYGNPEPKHAEIPLALKFRGCISRHTSFASGCGEGRGEAHLLPGNSTNLGRVMIVPNCNRK